MCLFRPQYNIAVAEADTQDAAWTPDVVVGISQWAALFSISYEIAERLVDYGDELNHQNRASVTSVSGNAPQKTHQTFNTWTTLPLPGVDDCDQAASSEARDAESDGREILAPLPWRAKLEGDSCHDQVQVKFNQF